MFSLLDTSVDGDAWADGCFSGGLGEVHVAKGDRSLQQDNLLGPDEQADV